MAKAHSIAEICRPTDISKSTLYSYLAKTVTFDLL
jgi:hypothetical protein